MKQKLPVRFNLLQALLIILGLASSGVSYGQALLETFDNTSLPTGWSNFNNTGSSSANLFWKFSGSPDYAMNGTVDHTGNGGSYAWVDGSFPSSGMVSLESPGVPANTLLNPELRFWMKRNTTGYSLSSTNTFTVDLYDGTNWNNGIMTHTTQTVNGSWELFAVNLATYTLTGNIKVRFNVDKTGSPAFYDDITLDDVAIVSVASNDAAPSALLNPTLPACSPDSIFELEIKNHGIDTLTSLSIGWSINGVAQTPATWTGSLAQNEVDTVSLGQYVLAFDDSIAVWTYNLNGGVIDEIPANDTMSIIYSAGLSGTYVLGAGQDYTTFNEVLDDIDAYGLCGPVVIEVEDGTYNEQLNIPEYSTSNSTNTVTFTSQSGDASLVVLSYSATSGNDNYTVQFNGSNNFIFDQISIENLGSSNSRVVVFDNEATSNTVQNCILTAPTTTSSYSNARAVVYSNGAGNDGNSITDNVINNGCYGVYYYGNFNSYAKGVDISGNEMLNQYQYGIYTYYHEDLKLNDNYIATDNAYLFSYAMYVYYSTEPEVVGNFVDETADAYYYGLYTFQVNGSLNKWANISGNRLRFENYGLYLSNALFAVVSNNTIMTASSATSTSSRSLYLTNGGVNQVFNNNLINNAGGYAYYLSGNPIHISDNNNFYSSGSNFLYSGGNNTTVADFIAASGHDSSSVSVMNTITDTASLKSCADSLDGAGMINSFNLSDFEGDLRDGSTPDIGADEFAALSSFGLGADVTLCDGDSLTLSMFYYDTIAWSSGDTGNYLVVTSPASYTVSVSGICGSASDTINVNAQPANQLVASLNLCVGQTSTLDPMISNGVYSWSTGDNTPTLDVNAAGTYDVTVVDEFGCLSTASANVTQSVSVDLDSLYEYCTGASAFLDAAVSGSYLWSDGSTGQTLNVTSAGTYTVTVTDPHNCVTTDQAIVEEVLLPMADFGDSISYYTVILNNLSANGTSYLWDFGDGNTSTDEDPSAHVYGWGSGTYTISLTVTNQCGSDTYTSDVYVDQDTNTSVNDLDLSQVVKMYPNPTEGVVNLNIVSVESSDVSYQVIDMRGSVLYTNKAVSLSGNFNDVIDLSTYAKGVYFVKVSIGDQFMVQRITLK